MKTMMNILSGIITMSILFGITMSALMSPNVDPKELECLAMNVYHEARSERVEGQLAVAHVTANRVAHKEWGSTICDVVYEHKQFSWTFLLEDHTPHETPAYNKAKVIARDVLIGNTEDPTHGAVFYHASYVNPSWAKYMDLSKVIGLHIFYTWDGDWNE
jgi:N-acetylmuramoyl-L-alanine amidase